MSGELKFGDKSKARAERILAFTEDGSDNKISIIDEESYVASIAPRVKARVSFKSASIKEKKVKTGGRILRSVIRAELRKEKKVKTEDVEYTKIDLFIKEELEVLNYELRTINEDIGKTFGSVKDAIKSVASKVISFLKKIVLAMKSAINKGVNYFLDFLGLQGEIEGIDEPVSFI